MYIVWPPLLTVEDEGSIISVMRSPSKRVTPFLWYLPRPRALIQNTSVPVLDVQYIALRIVRLYAHEELSSDVSKREMDER